MRVIKPSRLREYAEAHARAGKSLKNWCRVTQGAVWHSFLDVRRSFGNADEIKVKSGKTVAIFNIGGNNYRMIFAIHYNRQKVFVLRFLTHAEYDKDEWKLTL